MEDKERWRWWQAGGRNEVWRYRWDVTKNTNGGGVKKRKSRTRNGKEGITTLRSLEVRRRDNETTTPSGSRQRGTAPRTSPPPLPHSPKKKRDRYSRNVNRPLLHLRPTRTLARIDIDNLHPIGPARARCSKTKRGGRRGRRPRRRATTGSRDSRRRSAKGRAELWVD
jgi:hypothetical protein